jgi:hypothetical protein
VIKGDTDKVLFYYQGGGACWDQYSTKMGWCSSDAVPSAQAGYFDRVNTANPYKRYTVVQVLYCSGDVHVGDVTRPYTDSAGKAVIQKGEANAQSVLDWVKKQQAAGQLASPLADLVVAGCSAGSMGAQIWAQKVLEGISWTRAAVIPDSYAGVFPANSQGPLIQGFGTCPYLQSSLQTSCNAKTITLQDITDLAIKNINAWARKVPFSFIQSKTDAVQISFYVAVGVTNPDVAANITEAQFYNEVNKIFERYNKNTNFVNYMVNGGKHCYTPDAVVYTADTTGQNGGGGVETMIQWTGKQPFPAIGGSVTTDCTGTSLSQAYWSGTTYCDSALQGKNFPNWAHSLTTMM